jgi:hypothetical protein
MARTDYAGRWGREADAPDLVLEAGPPHLVHPRGDAPVELRTRQMDADLDRRT